MKGFTLELTDSSLRLIQMEAGALHAAIRRDKALMIEILLVHIQKGVLMLKMERRLLDE